MHWQGSDLDDQLGRAYDHRVVTRLVGYLHPYRWVVALAAAAMVVYTGTVVALPWAIQRAIDSVVMDRSLEGLEVNVLLFAGLAALSYGTQVLHLRLLAAVSQWVLYDLRTALFDHLQRLSLSFFDRWPMGVVMSRVQNDVQALQEFLSIIVLSLGDLLTLVGIVVAMLLMDFRLGLVTLSVLPVLFLITAVWQRSARRSFMQVRRALAQVNAGLQENISGVRVVQSLNREEANIRRFDRLNARHLEANLGASRLSAALMPVVEVLTAVATGLVVVAGGLMVLRGELAIGVVVAFALYVQRFFDPIRNLMMQYTQLQRAMVAGDHILELLDERPQVVERPDAVRLNGVRGEVRFEGVSFEYVPGQPVLQDIELVVRPGETVALVGPTGAGKSTLVSLAVRFYDPTRGRVTLDGVNLRDVAAADLARSRAMVLQEPFLFSGSIRENIRYAREVSDEAVEAAARAVGAHDFIARLPEGYDTPVYERGVNLSQGQRQLIALARAVAADPRLIILDEATASVDSHTEALIQEALRTALRGRTAIVIAHRLSTVRSADRIVVLEGGRIVEQGSHGELVRRGGLYAQLYATYFSEAAAGNGHGAAGEGAWPQSGPRP